MGRRRRKRSKGGGVGCKLKKKRRRREACEVSPEAKNGLEEERASPDKIYKTGSVIYFYFAMSISTCN
jgi:hypothetical protein